MRRPSRINALLVAAAALVLLDLGCSARMDDTQPASTLTEHQRDSVIARSDLPGARVVGRALSESERATHQAARVDSLTR